MSINGKILPSQKYLSECFFYCQETGALYWKKRPKSHFKSGKYSSDRKCNIWNGKNANKIAQSKGNCGYWITGINNCNYKTHRVIWKLIKGFDPKFIDHIDGNKKNNLFMNLSNGSRTDNLRNTPLRINNKTGIQGVHFNNRDRVWVATIGVNSKQEKILFTKDFFEACCARKSAEKRIGYHENHGRKK